MEARPLPLRAEGKLALEELLPASSRLCFLVGSGISLDFPSCQPTGFQFTSELLRQVVPSEEVDLVAALTDPEKSGSVPEDYFLRFEQLLQHVQQFDPELHVLDAYGRCDRPNSNHVALANFAGGRHIIFTTNFDNLLEYGLREIEVPKHDIVPVIFEEDWRKRKHGHHCHVFKLHGSLVDFRTNSDSRSSVQATMHQVALGQGRPLQLPDWKLGSFSKALKAQDLVVLGYSGLDDFDIMPSLASVDSARNVLWVDHVHQRTSVDAARTALVTGESSKDKRIDGYLRALSIGARAKSKVVKIQIHTGTFLRWLANRFFDATFPEPRRCPESKAELPESLRLTEAQKCFLAGDIYSYFNPKDALRMFKEAIEHEDSERSLKSRSHNYVGRQLEALMLRAAKGSEEFLGHMAEARSSYESALSLFDPSDAGDMRERSTVLNNLGTLHQHLGGAEHLCKAMDYFQQSLDFDDRPGAIARTYNNLGAAEYARGHLDAAIWYSREACEQDRVIGDLWNLAVHMHNLGYFLCLKGDADGVNVLTEALRISKQLGSLTGQANCLHSLARHYENNGNLEEAERHYEQAAALVGRAEPEMGKRVSLSRRRFERRLRAEEPWSR